MAQVDEDMVHVELERNLPIKAQDGKNSYCESILNELCHFCCYLAKTIQKSFFLTFTLAENVALKLRINTSYINQFFGRRVIHGTFLVFA